MDAGSDLPRWRIGPAAGRGARHPRGDRVTSRRSAGWGFGSIPHGDDGNTRGEPPPEPAAAPHESRRSNRHRAPAAENVAAIHFVSPPMRAARRLPGSDGHHRAGWKGTGTTGARMRANRRRNRLLATIDVDLRKPGLFAEHLAHELEHVLEQIDGVDLPRLASRRVAGVIDEGGSYETVRAMAVGRAAARESRLP